MKSLFRMSSWLFALNSIAIIFFSYNGYSNCTATKIYNPQGVYIGCEVVRNGKKIFSNSEDLTELGCTTACDDSRGSSYEPGSNGTGYVDQFISKFPKLNNLINQGTAPPPYCPKVPATLPLQPKIPNGDQVDRFGRVIPPFEKVCSGEIYAIHDGLCQCKATEEYINPWWHESKDLCEFETEVKKICLDSKPKALGLRFTAGRCFCPFTRWYFPSFRKTTFFKDDDPKLELKKMLFQVKECELFTFRSIDPKKLLESAEKVLPEGYYDSFLYLKNGPIPTFPDQDPGARTVKPVGPPMPGMHGGTRQKIQRRIGETVWEDGRDDPGQQGDPRWGPQAFGPILGHFFGFEIQDENTVIVPDVKELSGAIEKLSLKNHVGVYSAPEGAVTARIYLKNFVDHGALPVAQVTEDHDYTYTLHDLDYHVAGLLFMPDEIVDIARRRAQAIFDYEAYLRENYPEEYANPFVKYAIYHAIQHTVDKIDQATAGITRTLAGNGGKRNMNQSYLEGQVKDMLGESDDTVIRASPLEILKARLGVGSNAPVELHRKMDAIWNSFVQEKLKDDRVVKKIKVYPSFQEKIHKLEQEVRSRTLNM